MHPGSRFLWGCSALTACDSAPITSHFRNGDLSASSSIGETAKQGGWGTTVMLFMWIFPPWDGELSWCNSQFFCRQSSERSLRTFSRSRRKTSQSYTELNVWHATLNFLWTIPLVSNTMMNMLLTLPFPCLAILSLGEFGLSVYDSWFLTGRLSNLCQGLRPEIASGQIHDTK
jgi:hypothetical protein